LGGGEADLETPAVRITPWGHENRKTLVKRTRYKRAGPSHLRGGGGGVGGKESGILQVTEAKLQGELSNQKMRGSKQKRTLFRWNDTAILS